MELYVLDSKYNTIGNIDSFKSLEWVPRFNDPGDFVLSIEATAYTRNLLKAGNVLQRIDDDMTCIIEQINIVENENEHTIKAIGRGLESLLERRIVLEQTNSSSGETAEAFIYRLINENAVNTGVSARNIPGLKIGEAKGFTEKIEKQLTGDNLLTAISDICKTYNYGYKIVLNENKELIFTLYKGVDRSYGQDVNPYVVFSESYDNLSEVEYNYDETPYKNVALVLGEGEGTNRQSYLNVSPEASDPLKRREMYVDARDISSNDGEISTEDYINLLRERGNEKLAEAKKVESLNGIIDTANTYIYKEDYFIGDIVQLETTTGIKASSRIIEIIESENENGYKVVPTFEAWNISA